MDCVSTLQANASDEVAVGDGKGKTSVGVGDTVGSGVLEGGSVGDCVASGVTDGAVVGALVGAGRSVGGAAQPSRRSATVTRKVVVLTSLPVTSLRS